MPKADKRITINLTGAQLNALLSAKEADKSAPVSNSELAKRLIAEYTQRHGVEFPESENTWGGRRLAAVMKDADELTDYGKNDPAGS